MHWRTVLSFLFCTSFAFALSVETKTPARGSALAKLRRAADAADDLIDSPPDINALSRNPGCYAQGGDCRNAMLHAAALSDAVAQAQAHAQPKDGGVSARDEAGDRDAIEEWCNQPGNYCDKLRHQWEGLNAHVDRIGAEEAHVQRRGLNAEFDEAMLQSCKSHGGKCRRDQNSYLRDFLAKALKISPGGGVGWAVKSNNHVPGNTFGGVPKGCFSVGEPCFKLKRAVDLIQDLAAENVDELPEEQKRSIDPARLALSELGKTVAAKREEMVQAGIIA